MIQTLCPFLEELETATVSGEAISEEIQDSMSQLGKVLKKDFDVLLLGDDRAVIAMEALAKWVMQSIIEADKERAIKEVG